MTITYRILRPGESEQYRKIRLESLKAHPESFGATYEDQKSLPKLMFEKAIEKSVDERFMIGAFDQDELIGIFGFVPFTLGGVLEMKSTGTLIQMYVLSTYSGRKIGLNLTKAVVHEAFKRSAIDQIILGVNEGNIPAIRVYEQAGFQPYNSKTDSKGRSKDGFRVMIIYRDPSN